MWRPRVSGPRAELTERELHVTCQIELDDAVGEAVDGPHVFVSAHQHAVRRDPRPLLEELPVGIEHLDAAVAAIGHEDARRRSADGNAMRRVELPGTRAAASPLQQRLAGLVELHHARVAVSVRDEERAVRQPVDHRRTTEPREVVVLAELVEHAEGLYELLTVV